MQESAEFDKYAHDYRSIHNENIRVTGGSSDYFAEYKVELTSKLLSGRSIRKILDLGCGDGLSAFFFHRYFPETEITGIDPSGDSIEEAQKKNIPSCSFSVYDGSKIPFPDNSFDLVFLSCILHHVPASQYLSLLGECFRVLRTDGMIVIFEHNPLNPVTLKIVKDCPFDEDAVLIRAGKLRSMFRNLPFRSIQVKYTLFLPRHKFFNWLLGIENYLQWLPFGGQYVLCAVKS